MGNKLIECVPNYSEGRDLEKIEKIVECFRAKKGVRLLDYQTDPNHNRLVVTVIGEPEPLRDAVVASFGRAVELIDMTKHEGQHPRMGARGRGSVHSVPQRDSGGGRRPGQGGSENCGRAVRDPLLLIRVLCNGSPQSQPGQHPQGPV